MAQEVSHDALGTHFDMEKGFILWHPDEHAPIGASHNAPQIRDAVYRWIK